MSAGTLSNKVALITGASRGIGRAIALEFARCGAELALIASSPNSLADAGKAVTAVCAADVRRPIEIAVDLRVPMSGPLVRQRAIEAFGRIDILVNCAGATRVGDFLTFTEEDWDDGFALKFSAARRLATVCWDDLQATEGTILNIVGSAGRTPGPEYTIGGSVNAALLALTKALAARGMAAGVRVNAINPGPVRTDRLAGMIKRIAAEQGIEPEQAEKRLQESFGVTRFGEPEDIAALAAFVVSPRGKLLQGALLDSDGGLTKSI